jgi:7-carboxy-7-deazaguanine synthase
MNIKEIFFSYQAEGPYIGSPTLFVRFSGCNLNCYYCDTKYAKKISSTDKIELNVAVKKVLDYIKRYKPKLLSLTGGEPLLQKNLCSFIKKIIKNYKIKIYLETNASLVGQFKKVVDLVDICAINLKIPDDDVKNKDVIKKSEEIVNLCKNKNKEFFIKIVVCGKNIYKKNTFNKIRYFLIKTRPKVLVLQPETNSFKEKKRNLFFNITKIFEYAKKYVSSIHIIPQLHRTIYNIK